MESRQNLYSMLMHKSSPPVFRELLIKIIIMEIIKIISEWKKKPKARTEFNKPIKSGCKRVMAMVKNRHGELVTRHIDVKIT